MISSCANPVCYKPFHYLHNGRLYGSNTRPSAALTRMLWMRLTRSHRLRGQCSFGFARSVRPSCR